MAPSRWELTIYGRDTIETGDLRLDTPATGRLLLQHDDSAFLPLHALRILDGRISFSLARGHRQFEGTFADAAGGHDAGRRRRASRGKPP